MSNKPALPNAYADINNRNLGLSPSSPSGVFAYVGVCQEGSAAKDAIVAINSPNDAKTLLGYGELVDDILLHIGNKGKKVYAVPLDITTESTISAVTPVRAGTSSGTIALAKTTDKKVTNEFDLKFLFTKTGVVGAAKLKISTDGGVNYGAEIVMPATYAIPGTNITATFTVGASGFDVDDYFTATTTKPQPSTGDIEDAVDALIANKTINFAGIAIAADADAALMASLKSKLAVAEGDPSYIYGYVITKPALSTSETQVITQAATLVATVVGDRLQIVTGEQLMIRSNHADQRVRNGLGIVTGRRSALGLSEDIGLVAAGAVYGILDNVTGWTDTTIQELDALRTVTFRQFKGLGGWYITNGHMTDGFSDIKKDAWRLVLDKAATRCRLAALGNVKIKVDPTDVSGSTQLLRENMQAELDIMAANDEIVSGEVSIPDGQDILTTDEIKADVEVVPFGHASWIGITIGLVNPLRQA
jgi:hypothetical protein